MKLSNKLIIVSLFVCLHTVTHALPIGNFFLNWMKGITLGKVDQSHKKSLMDSSSLRSDDYDAWTSSDTRFRREGLPNKSETGRDQFNKSKKELEKDHSKIQKQAKRLVGKIGSIRKEAIDKAIVGIEKSGTLPQVIETSRTNRESSNHKYSKAILKLSSQEKEATQLRDKLEQHEKLLNGIDHHDKLTQATHLKSAVNEAISWTGNDHPHHSTSLFDLSHDILPPKELEMRKKALIESKRKVNATLKKHNIH